MRCAFKQPYRLHELLVLGGRLKSWDPEVRGGVGKILVEMARDLRDADVLLDVLMVLVQFAPHHRFRPLYSTVKSICKANPMRSSIRWADLDQLLGKRLPHTYAVGTVYSQREATTQIGWPYPEYLVSYTKIPAGTTNRGDSIQILTLNGYYCTYMELLIHFNILYYYVLPVPLESLLQLCRLKTREAMMMRKGFLLESDVSSLNLPRALKEYLMYR